MEAGSTAVKGARGSAGGAAVGMGSYGWSVMEGCPASHWGTGKRRAEARASRWVATPTGIQGLALARA
jgi:hypothetical protein